MDLKFQTRIILFNLLFIILIPSQVLSEDSQIYGEIFPSNSRSLLLSAQNRPINRHKCEREIPALFFQTIKNKPESGNGSTIYYHRIEVCCEGYTRSRFDFNKCIPDCSQTSANNCRNGFCRTPNQCECFDEFVRNDRGDCIHTCPIECQNGRCYLNGTCVCNYGYTLDPQTRKFCRPECSMTCGNNQECVAPGKCECKRGYRQTIEFGCQPICTPDCGYGKCVGPNQCECFPGYSKRPQRNVCEASCYINCENGFCESHYKCQCRDGYKYDPQTTSCLPNCGNDCENGICIAPGVCRCFEGYELWGKMCQPKCYNGCGYYGRCIDVNICACGNSKQRCLMGYCNQRGRCLCKTGHTHFIDRCIEPRNLSELISTYEQRQLLNYYLKLEFEGVIGSHFQF